MHMKPTFFHCFVVVQLLVPVALLAQASFLMRNLEPGYGIDAPVFDANGLPLYGRKYLAELWGGPTMGALTPAMVFGQPGGNQRLFVPFDFWPGYFSSDEAFLSVTTVPLYGYAWLEVRAWDSRLGATYEEVAALGMGGYGESPLFYAQGTSPYYPPEDPAPLIGLQSFSLRPVPEPSTLVLAAMGALGLWWAGRKQRRRIRIRASYGCTTPGAGTGVEAGAGDAAGGALVPVSGCSCRSSFFCSTRLIWSKIGSVTRARLFRAASKRPALIWRRAKWM